MKLDITDGGFKMQNNDAGVRELTIKHSIILENLVKSQEELTKELQKTNDRLQGLTEAVLNQKILASEVDNLGMRVKNLETTRWFLMTIILTGVIGGGLKLILNI